MSIDKLQIVTDRKGNVVGAVPARLKKQKEGPSGVMLEPLADQQVFLVDIPPDMRGFSIRDLAANCVVLGTRKAEVAFNATTAKSRPKAKKGTRKKR